MTDALEDDEGTVSSGGRTSTNPRFADEIDGLVGEEEELAKWIDCLDKPSTAYSMEISAEKTKLTKNNTSGINTDIKVNGKKLETVTISNYLDSVYNWWGFQVWNSLQDSTDNSSIDEVESSFECKLNHSSEDKKKKKKKETSILYEKCIKFRELSNFIILIQLNENVTSLTEGGWEGGGVDETFWKLPITKGHDW